MARHLDGREALREGRRLDPRLRPPPAGRRRQAPALGLLLMRDAIGMVSVVCAALARHAGNRVAIRINAAASPRRSPW